MAQIFMQRLKIEVRPYATVFSIRCFGSWLLIVDDNWSVDLLRILVSDSDNAELRVGLTGYYM